MIFSLNSRLKILVYFGAAVLILSGFFTDGPEVAGITIGRLGIVELAITALIVVFNQWAWRWKYVVRFLRTGPVLRGTWKGESVSTYDGETRETFIAVRQTFAEIEVRLLSDESTSETTSCQLLRRPDGLTLVEYSYANTPRATVRDRSEPHFGAARLECTGQLPTRIQGSYWTDRRSTGELEFTEHKPAILQTYADAKADFD